MKLKKIFTSLATIAVALTAGVQGAVTAYAAPLKAKYISDIKSIRCVSAEEAKQKFEAEGYILLNTNVNPTLDGAVYIGYKTSHDVDDAITGLHFMNMKGQYSFSQYEQVLNDHREMVDYNMDRLIPSIQAYRENYEAGTESAVHAYEMLNNVFDSESNEYMGDFLLNCSLESGKREPLVNAMMKGNAGVVQGIHRLLAMASATGETSWLDRLEETDFDTLMDEYLITYVTPSRAGTAMAQDFGEDAMTMKTILWDTLYLGLQDVETYCSADEDGNYDMDAALEKFQEGVDENDPEAVMARDMAIANAMIAIQQNIGVYEILQNYEYNGETLLDFFNRPSDEVTLEELYPLLSVMTEAQRGTMESTELANMITASVQPDDWDSEQEDIFSEFQEGMNDSISLYYDVNLRAFESGVAMTSAATQRDVTGYDFLRCFRDNSSNDEDWENWTRVWGMSACAAGCLAAGTLSLLLTKGIHQIGLYLASSGTTTVAKNAIGNQIQLIYNAPNQTYAKNVFNPVNVFRIMYNHNAQSCLFWRAVCTILECITFVCQVFFYLSVIATVAAAISMLWKSVEYTTIPAVICDAWQGEEFSDYIFYDALQGIDQTDMEYADMNGYDQKTRFWSTNQGWLVLYATKDKRVGQPLTELKFQTGSDKAPLGFEGVTIFGKGAVANLTSEEFTGQSTDPQIYLFCKRTSAPLSSTVQTGGLYVATTTLSLLLGGAVGAWIGTKRRRKTEPATI